MSRKAHRQVHEQLTEWADSAPPLPSPALAQFMGPLRPRPAASSRAVRAAVRTGLGIKVFGLLAAMAVTGAAAVGVTQVAQHQPEPVTPVVVPAETSDDPGASTAETPGDEPTTSATPSATPRPRSTSSTPPAPRVHRTRSASPTPRPHPSSHESEDPDGSSSEAPDQPDRTSAATAGDPVPTD